MSELFRPQPGNLVFRVKNRGVNDLTILKAVHDVNTVGGAFKQWKVSKS